MEVMEMEGYNESSGMATPSSKHTMSATEYLISAHVSAQQRYFQQSNPQEQGTLRAESWLLAADNSKTCNTTGIENIHVQV